MTFFFDGIDPTWRERAVVDPYRYQHLNSTFSFLFGTLSTVKWGTGDYNLGVFHLHLCPTAVAC
jgi:hypothetical protein